MFLNNWCGLTKQLSTCRQRSTAKRVKAWDMFRLVQMITPPELQKSEINFFYYYYFLFLQKQKKS